MSESWRMQKLFAFEEDAIKIVLIGDKGSGKTSLVSTLVSESFPSESVCKVMPPFVVPQDLTPEGFALSIVDTAEGTWQKEAEDAHCIVLVIAVDDQANVDKLLSYWMPLLEDFIEEKRLLIAFNKVDAAFDGFDEKDCMRLFSDDLRVDICLTSSAKELLNVPDVFYCAQRAVLYPSQPLLDHQRIGLSTKFKKCLHRIFLLCDKDMDGVMNDTELCAFQMSVFDEPLDARDIRVLKQMLQEQSSESLKNDALTLHGFEELLWISTKRKRFRMAWEVLFAFGYGGKLELRQDYIPNIPKRSTDQVFMVSTEGMSFLEDVYRKVDPKDEGLTIASLASCFSMCTSAVLVRRFLKGFEDGLVCIFGEKIRLEGFLALWSLLIHFELKNAVRLLLYIGCERTKVFESILVLSQSKSKVKLKTNQKSFHFIVFGSKNTGKSLLCRDLVYSYPKSSELVIRTVARVVKSETETDMVLPEYVTLMISEVPAVDELQQKAIREMVSKCDLVVVMHNPRAKDSLYQLEQIVKEVPECSPVVVLSYQPSSMLESEGISSIQVKSKVAREKFNETLSMYHLKSILLARNFEHSSKNVNVASYIHTLLSAAVRPKEHVMSKPSTRRRRKIWKWTMIGATGLVLGGLTYVGYRKYSEEFHDFTKLAKSSTIEQLRKLNSYVVYGASTKPS